MNREFVEDAADIDARFVALKQEEGQLAFLCCFAVLQTYLRNGRSTASYLHHILQLQHPRITLSKLHWS